jgi:dienelactone hydrolase
MKRILTLILFVGLCTTAHAQYDYEATHRKSLDEVIRHLSERFQTRLKVEVDTVGKWVPQADSRIRPYSIEESLNNVLTLFNYKFVKQNPRYYKIKPYEPHRRLPEEGKQMIDYLTATYYQNRQTATERLHQVEEQTRAIVERNIRELRALTVQDAEPFLTKKRKYNGYTVQNFRIETLPGLYLCGSIYAPAIKLKEGERLPVILSPDGHTPRYLHDNQLRMAAWARMGAVAVAYDLVGYGESALQLGEQVHHSVLAQQMQWMNTQIVLEWMLSREDIDPTRVGLCGASGGGTQTMQMGIDERFTAICPVISLSSYFDGGCPCESAIYLPAVAGGTCNAELSAVHAPRPLGVVSDGKDWTAHVPQIEGPFLQQIYKLHNAEEKLHFYHYPNEGHDFGLNKRQAVYDFFARVFGLDLTRADETKLTLEPMEEMLLFGKGGKDLPAEAVRSVEELPRYARERAKSLR